MMPAAQALLAEFETAARAAQAAEAELRKSMSEQVARLERQRAFAFRRVRLVRLLADASGGEGCSAADAWTAQRSAVRRELGWVDPSEAHDAILMHLAPVGYAVWRRVTGTEDGEPAEVAPQLETFEAWFQSRHGNPFYALFDQYFPEVPVVDF